MPTDDRTPSLTGTVLQDRYAVERELGHGSFATCYLATDRMTGQTCVVKQLTLQGAGSWKDVELFEREARVLAGLNHPRIPRHRAFFTSAAGDAYFLVQDYVRGRNLDQVLADKKRLLANEVLRIAQDVADILAYLHRQHPAIVHRDIKPSNIILGPGQRAFLIDFGAVRDAVQADSRHGGDGSTVVGTYGYMPFEQFSGRALPASDIYALGATLVHLLTGRPPAEALDDEMRLDLSRLALVSPRLLAILSRMVHPDMAQRYENGTDLRAALHEVSRPPQVRSGARIAATLGIVGVCSLAGIVAVAVNTRKADAGRRPAVQVATAGHGLDRNLLAPGRFQTGTGWVVPDEQRKVANEQLRLRPGQTAYRDVDLTAFSGPGGTPLAISAGARVQYSWQAKAAIALWAEPSGKLLGEDTRSTTDTTRVIGRTIPLPKDTTTVRVVLYGLAAGPRSLEPSAQVTYYAPEFVVHEPGRLPVFAQLALGQTHNTAAAWGAEQRSAVASPFVPLYKRRRPSPPATPKPAPTVAPAMAALVPKGNAPTPKPTTAQPNPQVVIGGRAYVMTTTRRLTPAEVRPTPLPTPSRNEYRYDPRPTAYRPEPSATPLDFPSAWTYRTQIWIPDSAPQAPAAPAPHWGR